MKEQATPATQATQDTPYQRLQGQKLDPRIVAISQLMEKNPQLRETVLDLSSPRTPIERIRYLERIFRAQGVKRQTLAVFAKMRQVTAPTTLSYT